MFIDYAELMAEDEQLMSMKDWLSETDRFLSNNRRNVLGGKGRISHDDAVKKVAAFMRNSERNRMKIIFQSLTKKQPNISKAKTE